MTFDKVLDWVGWPVTLPASGWQRGGARKRRRRFVICMLALMTAAGIAATYLSWINWKQWDAVHATQLHLKRGDYDRARSSLGRALQLAPTNIEVWRQAAQVYEHQNSPEALSWRKRIAASQPGNVGDQLALVECAVNFGRLSLAEQTLRAVESVHAQDAENAQHAQSALYHHAAARLALALHRNEEAEGHWTKLIQLEPENAEYRFNLAIVRINLADFAKIEDARHELEELSARPEWQVPALRALISDARRAMNNSSSTFRLELSGLAPEAPGLAEGNSRRLLSLARELAKCARSEFSDHLIVLEVLHALRHADFAPYLAALQRAASAQATGVKELILWMNDHGLQSEAIAWVDTLPSELAVNAQVSYAVADALILRKDWEALSEHVTGANWQQIEFVRMAILARLSRLENTEGQGQSELATAIRITWGNAQCIALLEQLCERWGWEPERETVLWELTRVMPEPESALSKLEQFYRARNDASGSERVAGARRLLILKDTPAEALSNAGSR